MEKNNKELNSVSKRYILIYEKLGQFSKYIYEWESKELRFFFFFTT